MPDVSPANRAFFDFLATYHTESNVVAWGDHYVALVIGAHDARPNSLIFALLLLWFGADLHGIITCPL